MTFDLASAILPEVWNKDILPEETRSVVLVGSASDPIVMAAPMDYRGRWGFVRAESLRVHDLDRAAEEAVAISWFASPYR